MSPSKTGLQWLLQKPEFKVRGRFPWLTGSAQTVVADKGDNKSQMKKHGQHPATLSAGLVIPAFNPLHPEAAVIVRLTQKSPRRYFIGLVFGEPHVSSQFKNKKPANQRSRSWPVSIHRGEGVSLGHKKLRSGQSDSFIRLDTLSMSYNPLSARQLEWPFRRIYQSCHLPAQKPPNASARTRTNTNPLMTAPARPRTPSQAPDPACSPRYRRTGWLPICLQTCRLLPPPAVPLPGTLLLGPSYHSASA